MVCVGVVAAFAVVVSGGGVVDDILYVMTNRIFFNISVFKTYILYVLFSFVPAPSIPNYWFPLKIQLFLNLFFVKICFFVISKFEHLSLCTNVLHASPFKIKIK